MTILQSQLLMYKIGRARANFQVLLKIAKHSNI